MMEDLILYLRAALPHLRESTSTVAQELRLVRAWLDIVGRGAAQWSVDVDAAASAHEARLPGARAAAAGPVRGRRGRRGSDVAAAAGGIGGRAIWRSTWRPAATSSAAASPPTLGSSRSTIACARCTAKRPRFACRGASVGPGSEVRMELPLDRGEPDAKAVA